MSKRRISTVDIVIGEPLPWDIYDGSHNLLLRRNFIVRDERQIEELVQRGLFVEIAGPGSEHSAAKKIVEAPSALRLINQANKGLGRLLYNISNETGFVEKVMAIVSLIKEAIGINEDIALASIMLNRAASTYPVRHGIDTAILSLLIARSLNMADQEIDILLAAAVTMNVGMLRDQERLQGKADGLTDEDKDIIKSHPQVGMRLLKQAGVTNIDWLVHVLMHHENEDGSGYPLGKADAKIPLGTKILSIADRYCAQVTPRTYRKALLPNAVLRGILLGGQVNIDRAFAGSIMHVLSAYPPGAFVKLENGETAVVTSKGETTTTPVVHSLIGPRNTPLAFPIRRDTSHVAYAVKDLVDETQAAIHVSMQNLWGSEASL
jgi:HD-GYP domain-containing protein (c-di-GMP phosphodiesterase class II)